MSVQGILFAGLDVGNGTSRPRRRRSRSAGGRGDELLAELRAFAGFGKATVEERVESACGGVTVPALVNEFWTAGQRQAHSLHEISYRACFKPQLPRFFVERLTAPGDAVYDPFMGRGTTLLEAALLGRRPVGCDLNPLGALLLAPRLRPPALEDVAARLEQIDWQRGGEPPQDDLSVFYHPETLAELLALRGYLLDRQAAGRADPVDEWIRMVAVNRLTGHSTGFFSVYTLPPNQATSVAAQRRINERREQAPERRDVARLILRKTRSLLRDLDEAGRETLSGAARGAELYVGQCQDLEELRRASVDLVVTSPPFLDVVQYHLDNWLRCWFCGIDATAVRAGNLAKPADWTAAMTRALVACRRALTPGGHVAFEVGEVRRGTVRLEQHVLEAGIAAGFEPRCVVINDQQFTKTANCWGVRNNRGGTNSNRIVVLRTP